MNFYKDEEFVEREEEENKELVMKKIVEKILCYSFDKLYSIIKKF